MSALTVRPEEVKRLKGMGFLNNKGTDDFSARIVTVNGKVTASQHRLMADAAEKYGNGMLAYTTRLSVEVQGIPYEKIEEFKAKGAPIDDGAFGENLIVSGYDLKALPVGTRLRSGEVLLEVTQIGKQCHNGCEIYKIMGDCIMPREGIFTRVLHGGVLTEGDEIHVEEQAGETDGE